MGGTPEARATETRLPSDTARPVGGMEIFSDAVMAIAMVLLFEAIPRPVLLVVAPQPVLLGATDFGSFFSALGSLWATFATIILTFLAVAALWVHHHQMCRILERTNPTVLFLNSLFLLTVAFLVYAAGLFADLLTIGQVAGSGLGMAAAVLYGLALLLVALTFTGTWVYAIGAPRLVVSGMNGRSTDARTRSYGIACGLFGLAILLSLATRWASLVLDFIIVGWLFVASRHELLRPSSP